MSTALRRAARRRAFTLVEVVVVIALIVVLAALVLGVGTAVVKGSEARQTALLLGQLDTAAREWKAQSDREVTYGPSVPPYEIFMDPTSDDDSTAAEVTSRYFAIVSRSTAVREMLATVQTEFVRQVQVQIGDPPVAVQSVAFNDSWDMEIVVVLPGRTWEPADGASFVRDEDGTIHTPLENRLGAARNRQTFFVSAGPDGKFGDVGDAAGSPGFEAARDNIYSHEPLLPQVTP